MKLKAIFKSPIRIAILSVTGLAQLLLVMCGVIHVFAMLGVTAQWVFTLAFFVGFSTLIYPIYFLMAFDPPTREIMTRQNGK